MPAWRMALAGSIAGGVAGVFGNPAELMMVRMQADKAKPPESEHRLEEIHLLSPLPIYKSDAMQNDTTTETRFKGCTE